MTPEAKQAAEKEIEHHSALPFYSRQTGIYVQQAIDAATAKLREDREPLVQALQILTDMAHKANDYERGKAVWADAILAVTSKALTGTEEISDKQQHNERNQ
jgi:hypothetical protein